MMLIAYIADFGAFLLTGCVLTLIVSMPFLLVVILRRRQKRRAEQQRLQQIIDSKEHPHVTFDRSKPSKAELKHVEAHTMSLGLRKLVRTGTPYDKGVVG